MTKTLHRLSTPACALALALAAHAAGASQIQGTGIGATMPATIPGTTSHPTTTGKATVSSKRAKGPATAASGARK